MRGNENFKELIGKFLYLYVFYVLNTLRKQLNNYMTEL